MGTVLLTIVVSGVACVQIFANASLPADREGDAMLSPEQAWSAPPADDKPTETYLQIIDDSANKPGDGAQERKNPAVARDLRALAAPTEHASKLDDGQANAAAMRWASGLGHKLALAGLPLGAALLAAGLWWLRRRRGRSAAPALAVRLLGAQANASRQHTTKPKSLPPRRRAA